MALRGARSRSRSSRSTFASTSTARWEPTKGNAVYARLGEGRLLERPVYVPELLEGSVYLYYSIQAPRERPLGYSTTAPPEADRVARALRSGKLDPAELGVRSVVHFRDGRPAEVTSP